MRDFYPKFLAFHEDKNIENKKMKMAGAFALVTGGLRSTFTLCFCFLIKQRDMINVGDVITYQMDSDSNIHPNDSDRSHH